MSQYLPLSGKASPDRQSLACAIPDPEEEERETIYEILTLPLTERLYEPLIHHEALESGPGWAEVLADESSPFRKTSLREWSCAARPLTRFFEE
jgi:hypothetical protein